MAYLGLKWHIWRWFGVFIDDLEVKWGWRGGWGCWKRWIWLWLSELRMICMVLKEHFYICIWLERVFDGSGEEVGVGGSWREELISLGPSFLFICTSFWRTADSVREWFHQDNFIETLWEPYGDIYPIISCILVYLLPIYT